jgi:hypothetical protein
MPRRRGLRFAAEGILVCILHIGEVLTTRIARKSLIAAPLEEPTSNPARAAGRPLRDEARLITIDSSVWAMRESMKRRGRWIRQIDA